MTVSGGFCPDCGAARTGPVCATCGTRFDAAPAIRAGLASGLLTIEQLRMRLIPFRLAGLAAGLALWWFVAGPAFASSALLILGSLVVLVFGGFYLGNVVALYLLARRR